MRCVTPSEVLGDWAARTGKGGQVLEAEKKGHLRVVDKNGDTKQHDRWSAYINCSAVHSTYMYNSLEYVCVHNICRVRFQIVVCIY